MQCHYFCIQATLKWLVKVWLFSTSSSPEKNPTNNGAICAFDSTHYRLFSVDAFHLKRMLTAAGECSWRMLLKQAMVEILTAVQMARSEVEINIQVSHQHYRVAPAAELWLNPNINFINGYSAFQIFQIKYGAAPYHQPSVWRSRWMQLQWLCQIGRRQ